MKARSDLLSGAGRQTRRRKKGPMPRLPRERRRAMILDRAVEFFAEYGLTAQTRALAEACGVAQRLLYRYFPSKAALVAEVYEAAILSPFKAIWLVRLRDRGRPLEQRLLEFYRDYYEGVLTRRWLRLFMYASLAEARMAPEYIEAIIMEMLETIVTEAAADRRLELPSDRAALHEIGWVLHGAISHFAIRRHLYGASGQMPSEQIIELHVRVFLAGLPVMLGPAPAVNG
jgi:AcrR family transcriptional regulator